MSNMHVTVMALLDVMVLLEDRRSSYWFIHVHCYGNDFSSFLFVSNNFEPGTNVDINMDINSGSNS